LRISEQKYNCETIKDADDIYDLFITGSDQVWNPQLTGNDLTYTLSFVSDISKKASFAASFGNKKQFIINREIYLSQLSTFHQLSVREPIGEDEFRAIDKELSCHCDPVFLLAKTQWLDFADSNLQTKPFILFYEILPQKNLFRRARELSQRLHIPLLCVSERLKAYLSCKRIFSLTPSEFVSLIASASYVFTTSFHAVAFSLIFEKQFQTEIICKGEVANHRVEYLLNRFSLQNRSIDSQTTERIEQKINWTKVSAEIEKDRHKAMNYLTELVQRR
jgi:hypothetical protein